MNEYHVKFSDGRYEVFTAISVRHCLNNAEIYGLIAGVTVSSIILTKENVDA